MLPPLKRILLVEDEADIRTVATLALQAVGGFTIASVSNGHEALETAPTFVPDLILLDVMMPGLDGPATLHALRAQPQTAEIPVMFMTAKVQPQEVAELRALGALGVIAKPFSPMTLPTTINQLWTQQYGK
jgi:two-component system, OmpR family, response regulator